MIWIELNYECELIYPRLAEWSVTNAVDAAGRIEWINAISFKSLVGVSDAHKSEVLNESDNPVNAAPDTRDQLNWAG